MIKLNKELVIKLHKMMIDTTGGKSGVRDDSLLDLSLNSCFQTFDGKELYPTTEGKAAFLCYSLIKNHAFFDGNKRIGMLIMLSCLEVSNIKLNYSDDDIIRIGLSVADGSMDNKSILTWINSHKVENCINDK